jgi:GT2 family glycosyltransferase
VTVDDGGRRGLAGWGAEDIGRTLAAALRAEGHEVCREPSGEAGDGPPPDVQIALVGAPAWRPPPGFRRGARLSACWLLAGPDPGAGDLRAFDVVAAPTGALRTRLRREGAVASGALDTIPVAPAGEAAVDGRPPDPHRVALLGYAAAEAPALRALAAELSGRDRRFRVDWLASEPPAPGGAGGRALAVVGLAGLGDLHTRLAGYGVAVIASSPAGLADVGLLAARHAGAIVIAQRGPGGRDETILHDYDGFVSDEARPTPRFVADCVGRIAALAASPAEGAALRDRARRAGLDWPAVASLWLAAVGRRLRAAAAAPPRVTVVMSAYDAAPFVEDAVDSILAQTWADFEFVAVDDGSRDRTREILRGIEDPRLIVLEQPNGGLWAALNAGLRHARGELIARMDADDVSHPERLARQIQFLDRHPEVGLLGTAFYKVDRDGRIQLRAGFPCDDRSLKRQLTQESVFLHPTVVFRRRLLDRTGPYRRHEAEDYDLWLRMSERSAVANLEAPLHRLRRTGETRVAVYEREIVESAAEVRRQALQRCLGRPDPDGDSPSGRRRWLGLPDLRPDEIAAHVEMLQAWAETLLPSQPGLAARLSARALLMQPWRRHAWRALARSLLRRRPGRARSLPRLTGPPTRQA